MNFYIQVIYFQISPGMCHILVSNFYRKRENIYLFRIDVKTFFFHREILRRPHNYFSVDNFDIC